jgi:PAS domain S-box-containing protein
MLEEASQSLLTAVFTAMAEGVVVQDPDGTIRACNPSAERILGLTADQMMGRTSMDPRWRAVHEDGSDFPGDTHPAMVTLRTGEACSEVVMGVHRPDDSLVWILINSRLLDPDAEEGARSVVATFIDITQLRQLQEERERLSRELEQALTNVISDFIPMCASCKSIRDQDNNWQGLEQFLGARTGAAFTHTVCPTCWEELYPGIKRRGK